MARRSSKLTALAKLLKSSRESKHVEFKEGFDPAVNGEWCELLKDLVAIANSGGGVILFGIKNTGVASEWDPTQLLEFDPAKIVDKIAQ
jgi:predicted HTH transcriptional regulator